ncbi:hypothetical protein NIES2107_26460 [Nostoc carneum NIES-2107]|nr:hypothetical protein NIES2107_26460 [Nostoc carneum NIES-2107]
MKYTGALAFGVTHPTNEKLHPQGDGVLGHREWGMGHG